MPAISSPNSHGTMSSAHSETPTMDVDYSPAFRGFSVDVAGNMVIRLQDDSANITMTVLAGVIYPLQVKRFVTTSTTATGIHAFAQDHMPIGIGLGLDMTLFGIGGNGIPTVTTGILLETGSDFLLLENGDTLVKES